MLPLADGFACWWCRGYAAPVRLVAVILMAILWVGCGDGSDRASDKFTDQCDHRGPVIKAPGEEYTNAELADALCIKTDFQADGFFLSDCRVGILESRGKIEYESSLEPPKPMITNEEGTVGFTYDGSDHCATVVRKGLSELGSPAASGDVSPAVSNGGAQGEEADEEQIRDVMQRWGAATEPTEMCSLETSEAQQAEIEKASGADNCEEAMSPGTARTYSSIDVTMVTDLTARVEVEGSDITSYLLSKQDGDWKIDKYGTHVDLPAPESYDSEDPEVCDPAHGIPC